MATADCVERRRWADHALLLARDLLSEDLQEGFTRGGVTVVNLLTSPLHALLDALSEDKPG